MATLYSPSRAQIWLLLLIGITGGNCENPPNKRLQQVPSRQTPAVVSTPVGSPTTPQKIVDSKEPVEPISSRYLGFDSKGRDKRLTQNVYIIFDGSISMAGDAKIGVAKRSLKKVLTALADDINIGLWVFDRRGQREVQPLSSGKKKELLAQIDRIISGGMTPLRTALNKALGKLVAQKREQLGFGTYKILVLTDGEANDRGNTAQIVSNIINNGIILDVIGFQMSSDHQLRRFAHVYRRAENARDLQLELTKALGELERFEK